MYFYKKIMVDKVKNNGEVFTPTYIVSEMLNLINYTTNNKDKDNVLMKHIIDSSCGDGAFLVEIVKIYIKHFTHLFKDTCGLKEHLERYIHGIEINCDNYKKCLLNLNAIEFEIRNIKYKVSDLNVFWDIKNADALTINTFDKKMDYVVGNPPYVRIHNLVNKDVLKKYMFCTNGMTDLYLAFFELSFRQLNNNGKMVFITPNSWLTSNAGIILREYIKENKNLKQVIDLKHYKAFKGVTTYSLISCFNCEENYSVNYNTLLNDKEFIIDHNNTYNINYMDLFIDDKIYIGNSDELDILLKVKNNSNNKEFQVKNGFATLADDIFITETPKDMECNIPIWKASSGEWKACVFPYNDDGEPYSEDDLKQTSPFTYKYLMNNKDKLLKRSITNPNLWYLFGRTQAINDVSKDNKLAIPNIIKNPEEFLKKIKHVGFGKGIYSGLYILGDVDKAKEKLSSPYFMKYIKALRKYKNGGYYTFSSKDLEKYLNNF